MKNIKTKLKSLILKKLNINNCFIDQLGQYHHVSNFFNVECNVCENKLLTFLPYQNEPHQKCPVCSSLPRHRLLWDYLKATEYLEKEIKVLHLAPEKVFYKKFMNNVKWDYCSGDLFPENYFPDTEKVDLMDMPFDDNSFDMILCNHVLEHVDNDLKAIGEFRRVLKPNGVALIMIPVFNGDKPTFEDAGITEPAQRLLFFGQEDHVRAYGSDVLERFQKSGFSVEKISHYKKFSVMESFTYGFNLKEDIFAFRK